MALLIDPPMWPAHGRVWSHLISDLDLGELHDFAERLGFPARAFEGDHYDVPSEFYDAVVSAGALPVGSRELLRILQQSGLRLQKRLGDKGIARCLHVPLVGGVVADVDLVSSPRPFDERRVCAAMVIVADAAGDQLLVYSVRRREWGSPGGWRERAESVPAAACREVAEETGLVLVPDQLVARGYERFRWVSGSDAKDIRGDVLQVYSAMVDARRPALTASASDTSAREWVTSEEYRARCRALFWWPLAADVLGLAP